MADWIKQMDAFPDWKDGGRAIEMLMADGTIVRGRLWLEDVFPDSEGDETPIWRVVPMDAALMPDAGAGMSFWDAERYRFTD